ncbi:hypothetical protein JXL19_04935, partial [bacterium]|nr:hypothetical protein [bacterium]
LVKSNLDAEKPGLYRQNRHQIYNIKLIFRDVLDFLRGHQVLSPIIIIINQKNKNINPIN